MFAVMVKKSARKHRCSSGVCWVRDAGYENYVTKRERGMANGRRCQVGDYENVEVV